MRTAYGYIRVSSEDQADSGLGLEAQRQRIRAYCELKGLRLAEILEDPGISGGKALSSRPAGIKNICAGFEGNLRDYLDENVIAHAFHHNAFLIVSNGHRARYGSITSKWEHFAEWKRQDESDKGSLDAEVLLNGMLA
ncbi:MAG TPA: recombinase family protein, partial [Gemmataceae bacterium]|nr:recombinase family protein [Gemmataceae bacterium]